MIVKFTFSKTLTQSQISSESDQCSQGSSEKKKSDDESNRRYQRTFYEKNKLKEVNVKFNHFILFFKDN